MNSPFEDDDTPDTLDSQEDTALFSEPDAPTVFDEVEFEGDLPEILHSPLDTSTLPEYNIPEVPDVAELPEIANETPTVPEVNPLVHTESEAADLPPLEAEDTTALDALPFVAAASSGVDHLPEIEFDHNESLMQLQQIEHMASQVGSLPGIQFAPTPARSFPGPGYLTANTYFGR